MSHGYSVNRNLREHRKDGCVMNQGVRIALLLVGLALPAAGWSAPIAVDDEVNTNFGTTNATGNMLANDSKNGATSFSVYNIVGPNDGWAFYYGGWWYETIGTGGTLLFKPSTGEFLYNQPDSGTPYGGQLTEVYTYWVKDNLGGISSAKLTFNMPPFSVSSLPVLSTLDAGEDFVGIAENAAANPFANPPGARTARILVEDAMKRGYPTVRLSGVYNQTFDRILTPGGEYRVTLINFLNVDFESPEGLVDEDFAYNDPYYGQGTLEEKGIVIPKAGVYRYEAAASVYAPAFDPATEKELIQVTMGLGFLRYGIVAGHSIDNDERAYQPDPGEDGTNLLHIQIAGAARFAQGDVVFVWLAHNRSKLTPPYPLNPPRPMRVDESDPKLPYFELQFISE